VDPRPLAQDRFLRKHSGLVGLSEDDKLVACAAGEEAVILDCHGQELMGLRRKRPGRSAHTWSIAVSAEAGLAAAGYDDGTVCVWSLGDKQLVAQARLSGDIVRGIAFAGVTGRRFGKQSAQLVVTAGNHVVAMRASDLHVIGALPCATPPPSLSSPLFKSVAATRDGHIVAGGRLNGKVFIWLRGERGSYEPLHARVFAGEVIRLLLSDPGVHASQTTCLYVARTTPGRTSRPWVEGEQCEISTWEFSARAEPRQVAAVPVDDLTDIAAGRDGTVLSSHRYQYERRALGDHNRIVNGAVESHTLPPVREGARFFNQSRAGILSVAVTRDLRVAFARGDDGRITTVKPLS